MSDEQKDTAEDAEAKTAATDETAGEVKEKEGEATAD